ncbi:MAG: GTP cyclohydrolase I FolE2 [Conexivisphaerales archaeon]|nr:GTP cyclohydrolase I FolE2 [Conexivisphaerales archaeon]
MDWDDVVRRARDVQYEGSGIGLRIPGAGIGGLRIPLDLHDGPVRILGGSVDAFVDLPPGMRGVNMSRSVRAVLDSMDGARSLADFASAIVSRLLELHEYSMSARAVVRASAFIEEEAPVTGLRSPHHFSAIADFVYRRDGDASAWLGASVPGVTACPCGSELMRSASGGCGGFPCPTHMQRARVLVAARPAGSTNLVSLRSSAVGGLSASVYPLLRRSDEASVIHDALSNPRFAEDVFRRVALSFVEGNPSFPPDGELRVRVRSRESIHGHDVVVEGVLRGDELLSLRRSS